MTTSFTRAAAMTLALLLAAGCSTSANQRGGVTRVDADDRITVNGLDRLEIDEAADELTRRMLSSNFLDRQYGDQLPVRMVVSDIENLSDIPRFPSEVIASRVRTRLLESGKVQFVSFFGKDGTDAYAAGIQDELEGEFKELDPNSLPARRSLQAPRLSLRTQIQYVTGTNGQVRQSDYQVRMFVSDMTTGLVVWEGVSRPVSKIRAAAW